MNNSVQDFPMQPGSPGFVPEFAPEGVGASPAMPSVSEAPFDPAVLQRMANAMFAALPGAGMTPFGPQAGLPSTAPGSLPGVGQVVPLAGSQFPSQLAPAGSPLVSPAGFGPSVPGTPIPQGQMPGVNLIPASPAQLPSLANRAPALLPHAVAPNGAPDTLHSALPAYEPRMAGAVLGVPEAHALTPGQAAAHPVTGSAGATPFYFLGDSYGQPSPGGRDLSPPPVPAVEGVQPWSDGFSADPWAGSHVQAPGQSHTQPYTETYAQQPVAQSYAKPLTQQSAQTSGQPHSRTQPVPHPSAQPYSQSLPFSSEQAFNQSGVPQPFSLPDSFAQPFGDRLSPSRQQPAPASTTRPSSEPKFYFADAVVLPSGYVTPESPNRHGDQQPFRTPVDTPRDHRGQIPKAPQSAHPAFDVNAVRRDFPILQERVNGRPLVWFDNAATTQKPQSVIDRISYFYAHENSNIHRAAHELAARATDAYEGARQRVKNFINAPDVNEVIFVRGTTEAINLVAKSWGGQHVGEGDEIIVSHLEHHANIVPWQQLASSKGAKLRVIPVDDSGQVLLDEYRKLLSDRTKIVAVTQVSNALGTVVPVKEIIALAHRAGAKALVDGAQSVSHMRVDVQDLDADFFVFSGHKVFGPTGIGVVWGKRAVLEDMPPWQGGGNMIADVTFEKTVFQALPNKFEAGTGNIADAVGLGAAIDYVNHVGIENIARFEHDLLVYGMRELGAIKGVRLIGTAADKASVMSFVLAGYTTEEVGHALNDEGIAVRTGHHCAQPILRRFGVETTVRPSLAFYNTFEEIDRLTAVVKRLSSQRRAG